MSHTKSPTVQELETRHSSPHESANIIFLFLSSIARECVYALMNTCTHANMYMLRVEGKDGRDWGKKPKLQNSTNAYAPKSQILFNPRIHRQNQTVFSSSNMFTTQIDWQQPFRKILPECKSVWMSLEKITIKPRYIQNFSKKLPIHYPFFPSGVPFSSSFSVSLSFLFFFFSISFLISLLHKAPATPITKGQCGIKKRLFLGWYSGSHLLSQLLRRWN
jgi:hypothetical protein